MRIAIFVHCFFPEHFYGTETYTLNLAKQLQIKGHEPIVISAIFHGEPKKEEVVSSYIYDGIKVYCIDKNYFPHKRVKDTYYQNELRQVFFDLLQKLKPDLVHVTHLINHTAVLLEVVSGMNIPMVATFTDFYGFCFNCKLEAADGSLCNGPNRNRTNCLSCYLKAARSPYYKYLVNKFPSLLPVYAMAFYYAGYFYPKRFSFVGDITQCPDILTKCYSHYNAVIAATEFLRDIYIANGLTVPVHLIRFGIDLPRLPKQSRSGFPVKFGFIGQISHHKGTDILIEAFSRLPKGKAVLNIYGPENQEPLFMEKLKLLAKGYDVFFMGTFPSEKIAEVLSNLDFLVIPSRWHENSPLVLLNALTSHTPVIVSEGKGMTEFIEEGKNGYVFPMGSVEGLERVLKMIIENPESSRALFKTTEYLQTNEMMVKDVLSVYESVMSRN